ncbi:MAG: DUF5010 domain-containing protein [Phycisphaerales bacterium]|nr:MAG: DUF5010 domain-containing protein [Phycisphaerales bacterium]
MGTLCGRWQVWVLAFLLLWGAGPLGECALPEKAPGRFWPLRAEDHEGADSFERGRPVVGVSYFYWYDVETGKHVIDRDGTDAMTTHPADMNGVSYKRASWHEGQLGDMVEGGVDFVMPVYWGVPGKYDGWSFVGLGPLVEAHSRLQKRGVEAPAIGLFYDTSILKWNGFGEKGGSYHVDLTTDLGKDWFYTAMRDFFSMIPPSKWARVDGMPVVFLYAASFAKGQDPGQFEYVRGRFRKDFGVEPFIVKSADWQGRADAVYSWGGAVSGPLIYRRVVALGPGYDHSAVPGRAPLVVDRRDGATYIARWLKVLQLNPEHRPWMVHVETWNEWHEGTDVANSREYGRSYIVLTRLFADMWHAGVGLRLGGSLAEADSVHWEPGRAKGVEIVASGGDGVWERRKFGEVGAVVSAPSAHAGRYLYFNVDDAFAYELFERTVRVLVAYRDAGCSSFRLEYDSADATKGLFEGAFRGVGGVAVGESEGWRTAEFELPRCRFMNRCNGADFRIVIMGGDRELAVRRVEVVK